MPEIDPIILKMYVDAKDYNAGINRTAIVAEKNLARIEAAGYRMGSGVRTAMKGAAAGVAGFVASIGVDTVLRATRQALDYAGSLGEVAQSLGIGTQFLQEFRFAATQNGASVDSADGALAKFSITIGQALNGSKRATTAFNELGISVDSLRKASDAERFELVADAIAKIKDPAQQSASAVAIFGKGAREIIPTLQAGADAFRKQAEEARKYGVVLSDKQIQDADKTADKLDALTSAISVRFSGVVADNAAAIGQYAEALADLVDAMFKFQNAYPKTAAYLKAFAAGGPVGAAYQAATGYFDLPVPKGPAPRPGQSPLKPGAKTTPFLPSSGTFAPTGKGPLKGGFAGGAFGLGGAAILSQIDFASFVEEAGRAARDASPEFIQAAKAAEDLRNTLIDGETLDSRLRSYDRTLVADPEGPRDDGGLGRMLDRQLDDLDDYFSEYERRGERAQQFVAGQFETLFTGGIDDVWDNFKRIGLSVISDVLASLVTGQASGGGGGGILGSLIGGIFGGSSPPWSLFGRASGGYVGPGQTVRVNEQRGGMELLRMGSQGGTVIPLGAVNATAAQPSSGGSGTVTVSLMLSDDIDARIVRTSGPVAVEVLRAGAPGIVQAAAQETFRQADRFTI